MKTKDILIVGLLFSLLIIGANNIYNNHRIYKLQLEVLDTKKQAIEIYYENKEYISILQESRESLNDEIDLLNSELKQYKALEKLKKDLRLDRE